MSLSDVRKQLDALMGTNRDGDDPYGRNLKHFSDRDVCKHFICGLCPHDAFANTKKEMGPCPNLHSEPLKIQYEMIDERQRKEYGYDRHLGRILDEIVRECDKAILKQEMKLKENEAEKLENDPLSREISSLQAQAEKLGEEGKVDEYLKISAEIKNLEQRRLQQQVLQIPSGAAGEVIQQHGSQSQQQKLRVCEVCSCYLSKFDSDKRLADHFNGKLHMGYVAVREKLEDLKARGLYSSEDFDKGGPTTTVMRPSRERRREEPYSENDRNRRTSGHRDRSRSPHPPPPPSHRDRDRDHERDRHRSDNRSDRSSLRHNDSYRERDYGRDKHRHSSSSSRHSSSRTHRSGSSPTHHSSRSSKRNHSRSSSPEPVKKR